MKDAHNWFEIENVNELDSPSLVVFVERVNHNIQLAIEMIGDLNRLRPHIKTNKSPDVTKLMLNAGITKFKCATIAEAEMLAQCNAPDVLLAYQPLGPKLKRFVDLIKKYPSTKFSCLTDNIDAATEQSAIFDARGLTVPVYLDINVGMNRTGIIPNEKAVELATHCKTLKGISLIGLHSYDGHIRDVNFEIKKQHCDEAFALVKQLNDQLQLPTIIMGGSPAFSVHCKREHIECSPGTFVYWDKGYHDLCPEQKFLPAAVLVTRIISFPSPGRICTDLGHKSVAAENEITKRVFFLNAEGLKPVGQSEEHLVLETDHPENLKTGQVLYGLPHHVCPTVALYERVITIENNKVSGEWKTIARDRKISL
ncbi:MAG: D-TA family PLP-dependent enzyme [Sphingobacteriales bacterium]|nr:D-TA family PLP-dependent enzyme [Sphingobacteriales bacterium]MBI3720537.1 D-TA family PLP-dependent enzyme [Sphingobacteriales bacterium]